MDTQARPSSTPPPLRDIAILGFVAIVPAALFAIRIIWEETFLTIRNGPQMVGWAIVHTFPIAFLAPIFLVFWLIIAGIALVVTLIRRSWPSKLFYSSLAAALLLIALLSIPQELWEWTFIGIYSRSAHAADLMVTDAASGYIRTVRGYLDHGIAVNARNYDGSTAAHAAAVSGQLQVLELLVSRGADLNAVNNYGTSPLADAIEMKHPAVATYLTAHGAREIRSVKTIPPADTTITVDGGKPTYMPNK